MMRRKSAIIRALIIAVFAINTVACGNFSNEDLIFLAALPRGDELALRVPGGSNTQGQGLSSQTQDLDSCSEDNLQCQAINVSNGINLGVYGMLNLVDGIANNFQPTRREPGKRVWGPHFAIESNVTMRFEMARKTIGNTDIFEYCLHAVKGNADRQMAADIHCDREIDDSGLARVLYGSYSPAEIQGSARYGTGSVVLDLNMGQEAGVGEPGDQGRLTIDYDTTVEQTNIELHIRDIIEEQTLLPTSADYSYTRAADGSGDFRFRVNADFVGGFILSDLESLEIGAQWNAEEAGRADARVSGGDLASTVVTATQCWDQELATVFYEDSDERHPTLGQSEACAFSTALP